MCDRFLAEVVLEKKTRDIEFLSSFLHEIRDVETLRNVMSHAAEMEKDCKTYRAYLSNSSSNVIKPKSM